MHEFGVAERDESEAQLSEFALGGNGRVNMSLGVAPGGKNGLSWFGLI